MNWSQFDRHRWGPTSTELGTHADSGTSLEVAPLTLAISAPAALLLAGAILLGGGSQTIAITAPTAARTSTVTLQAGPTTLVLTAPPATRSAATTLGAGSQTLAITAPTATRTAGGVTRAAGSQTLVLTAPTATRSQATILAAGSQTLALTAPTASRTAGVSNLAAGGQTLAITAPTALRTTTITRAAGASSVAITAPAVTISQATTRAAGAQTLAISAPVAVRTVTAVTRAAGSQTLAITAPVAVRLATFTRAAGAQTVAITAPTATRQIGAAAIAAGRQTLVLTAPDVRILGGATLPRNIIVATIASRAPARTLVGAPQAAYADQVLADGAIGYWRLNDPGADPVHVHDFYFYDLGRLPVVDASGSGHHGESLDYFPGTGGTISDPPPPITHQVAGAVAGDTAMTFLEASQAPATGYAQVLNTGGWIPTGDLTLACWVRWQPVDGLYEPVSLLSRTGDTAPSRWWEVYLNGEVALGGTGAVCVNDKVGTRRVDDGLWHQVVVVIAVPGVSIYVDGVLDVAFADGALTGNDPTQRILFGRRVSAASLDPLLSFLPFQIGLDDVAIYPTAVSAAQVATQYALRGVPIRQVRTTLASRGPDRTVEFSG